MILVVGGGIFGVCVLDALARAGLPCHLLEQDEVASGVTGRSGGMVRIWHADDWMVEHAMASLPFWQQLPDCWHQTGSLYFETGGTQFAARQERVARLQARGARLEWLESGERFPQFDWSERPGEAFGGPLRTGAVYEPEAGWVYTGAACRAIVQRAQRTGAQVSLNTRVIRLLRQGDRVTGVETEQGQLSAQAVVWAGGPFPSEPLGPSLPKTQNRSIQVVRLEGSFDPMPCWLDVASRAFARPIPGGPVWLGVGLDSPGGEPNQPVDSADAEKALQAAASRWPGCLNRSWRQGVRSADRYTPDRRALFGPGPWQGFYWAWAGSGAGFKLAPSLASGLAHRIGQDLSCRA